MTETQLWIYKYEYEYMCMRIVVEKKVHIRRGIRKWMKIINFNVKNYRS